jgi:hypothetical protein
MKKPSTPPPGTPPPEPGLCDMDAFHRAAASGWLAELCTRLGVDGAPPLTVGAFAQITFGPSAGKIVRLERMAYAPPGSAGCAVHSLQPPGPVWVVSRWVEWVIQSKHRAPYIFRCKAAPVTALRPIALRVIEGGLGHAADEKLSRRYD